MGTTAAFPGIKIENIAYATDFHETSRAALPYTLSLARKYSGETESDLRRDRDAARLDQREDGERDIALMGEKMFHRSFPSYCSARAGAQPAPQV